jgi:hypothetical protein
MLDPRLNGLIDLVVEAILAEVRAAEAGQVDDDSKDTAARASEGQPVTPVKAVPA